MRDKILKASPQFLSVTLHGEPVGKLAKTKKGTIAFQYDESWLANGFSISPFSLPLEHKVFVAKQHPFGGLHGIFNDSMPDRWGRLLLDRLLRSHGIDPLAIDSLTRLAIVGQSGMGALEYEPSVQLTEQPAAVDLDVIAQECSEILRSTNVRTIVADPAAADPAAAGPTEIRDLDELFALGGSSGGARPKILTRIDDEDWIVKFPSSVDPEDIGLQEYELAIQARECGIEMPEVRLMPSRDCEGYFATKRFDRKRCHTHNDCSVHYECDKKIHMASAAALLETSHRIPNLDYDILLKLTLKLTGDMSEVLKMFRLMVFNVYAENRDDHAKNFSFLCDDEGRWRLAPGYDLTKNVGFNGEHTTTINGKGKNITRDDIEAVGKRAGLSARDIRDTIDLIDTSFAAC